jgi:peptide/nickel transport system permease protein
MKSGIQRIARGVSMVVALSLVGGLLSATLVRFAPGYGIDERELDPRLNQASLEAIRGSHRMNSGLLAYYGSYLWGAAHGNFGRSEWLQRPIAALVRERFPVTARSVLIGVFFAWAAAFAASLAGITFRSLWVDISGTIVSGLLIAIPTAVVAMFSVYFRAPVSMALAVVTFPKLFRYLQNLLGHIYENPHILAARARGVGQARIIFRHVLPSAAGSLFALLGVSLSMAFGAAIPIEALCDSPGIGQLAWQAALNRDLPLIMNLTLLVTIVTVTANSFANVSNQRAS